VNHTVAVKSYRMIAVEMKQMIVVVEKLHRMIVDRCYSTVVELKESQQNSVVHNRRKIVDHIRLIQMD
jgi:hypothetical protein